MRGYYIRQYFPFPLTSWLILSRVKDHISIAKYPIHLDFPLVTVWCLAAISDFSRGFSWDLLRLPPIANNGPRMPNNLLWMTNNLVCTLCRTQWCSCRVPAIHVRSFTFPPRISRKWLELHIIQHFRLGPETLFVTVPSYHYTTYPCEFLPIVISIYFY